MFGPRIDYRVSYRSSFHAYTIYSLCVVLFRSEIVSESGSSRGRRINNARFPLHLSLSRVTMKVSQTESASAVHHIVNARRFLPPSASHPPHRSLSSYVSFSFSSPPRSFILPAIKRDSIRLTFHGRSVPSGTVSAASSSLLPLSPRIFRPSCEAFVNGKYIPGERRFGEPSAFSRRQFEALKIKLANRHRYCRETPKISRQPLVFSFFSFLILVRKILSIKQYRPRKKLSQRDNLFPHVCYC